MKDVVLYIKKFTYYTNSHGGILIGHVLVIPWLLLLILAFIDIARVCAYRSFINHAAKESLLYAQTLPGLDFDNHIGALSSESQLYQEALDLLELHIMNKLRNYFPEISSNHQGNHYLTSSPLVSLPNSEINYHRRDKFRDTPITITIQLHINSFLKFLPGYNITGSASGFRELGPWFKYDRPMDGSTYITQSGSQLIGVI
jgi:hypothetical protein